MGGCSLKLFIDTANIDQIIEAKALGVLDGVTTNPSLFAREKGDWKDIAAKICDAVDGPVSLEVVALDSDRMVAEARELVKIAPNVVVKIPLTFEGIKAIRTLSDMDIETNATLVFSATQALLAGKAGATYVSPFIGRLDDAGQDGLRLVEEIVTIFSNYGMDCQVLAASIRSMVHVREAAMIGADVATIPFKVIVDMIKHPLTDVGLAAFLSDWEKSGNTL